MLGEPLFRRMLDSRRIAAGGQKYLYKGVNPASFGVYFAEGGITPDPQSTVAHGETWVTNDLRRALAFARISPIEGGQTCLAVADRSRVLEAQQLKPHLSLERGVTGLRMRDYSGPGRLGWNDLVALVATQGAVDRIYAEYERVRPSELPWIGITEKVVFVPPANKEAVQKRVLELASI